MEKEAGHSKQRAWPKDRALSRILMSMIIAML